MSRSASSSVKIPLLTALRQRIESAPPPVVEESIALRVAVQALVTVGMIATDVVAADVVDTLGVSLWAVPVSAVGGVWSWYRRHHRNIPVKFCIAMGMLLALALFFVNLVARNTDTRLILAELLIHLQVLHSFDLPRRRDLGYSMVIGLILIGVAGTISQTLAFAPWLFLFLAIALPVLILDYRSRLGLAPTHLKQPGIDLSPKRLVTVLTVVLALGLTIFALLPRFPGYQLRTFPVSAPIDFEGEFDGRAILNSGYVNEGREGEAIGAGNGNLEEGPGELDDQFYYGFNTKINQNLRGEMEPQIVMRVRSQAEGFWRVLAFDHYTGQGWEISRNDNEYEVETLERPFWTYRFLIPPRAPFLQTREVVQSYTIVSDLPNVIPALYLPHEVYFPTQEIAIDSEGALRSPVSLSEGLTYSIVSQVPYRDRTVLSQAGTTYAPRISNYYLQLPDGIADRVRSLTESILENAPNPITAPSEKALYLAQYLKQNYVLLPDMPFLNNEQDLVEAFLFSYGGGYPDHFSTVLTVMLRSIGIPSRLVVGFGPGEFNPFTGFYVVRNTDAYAMTEVFFPELGWFAFDPIPGHEIVPPSFEYYETFGVLKQFWQWIAGWLPSPVSGLLGRLFESIGQIISQAIAFLSNLFSRGWIGWLLGAVMMIAIGLVLWLLGQGWQKWRYYRWLSSLPPMESLYQQMLTLLGQGGFRKTPSQTPLEYAQTWRQHHPPTEAEIVDDITQSYVRWRYGDQLGDLGYLRDRLKRLKQQRRPKLVRSSRSTQ